MIGDENMAKIQKNAARDEAVDSSAMAKTYAVVARFLKLSEQKRKSTIPQRTSSTPISN